MTTEFNPQTTAPAEVPKSNKRRRALLILAAVIAVSAVIWTAWYLLVARWHGELAGAAAIAWQMRNHAVVPEGQGGTALQQ